MLVFPNFVLVSCNATPCKLWLIELSDTPLPRVVFVSLNPITPMFSYNRGHTEGITADICAIFSLFSYVVYRVIVLNKCQSRDLTTHACSPNHVLTSHNCVYKVNS